MTSDYRFIHLYIKHNGYNIQELFSIVRHYSRNAQLLKQSENYYLLDDVLFHLSIFNQTTSNVEQNNQIAQCTDPFEQYVMINIQECDEEIENSFESDEQYLLTRFDTIALLTCYEIYPHETKCCILKIMNTLFSEEIASILADFITTSYNIMFSHQFSFVSVVFWFIQLATRVKQYISLDYNLYDTVAKMFLLNQMQFIQCDDPSQKPFIEPEIIQLLALDYIDENVFHKIVELCEQEEAVERLDKIISAAICYFQHFPNIQETLVKILEISLANSKRLLVLDELVKIIVQNNIVLSNTQYFAPICQRIRYQSTLLCIHHDLCESSEELQEQDVNEFMKAIIRLGSDFDETQISEVMRICETVLLFDGDLEESLHSALGIKQVSQHGAE